MAGGALSAISGLCIGLESVSAEEVEASHLVMLSITKRDGSRLDFTESDFFSLPYHKLVTHTLWSTGPQTFEGVLMRDLLVAAGLDPVAVQSEEFEALGLNEYRIPIPADDFLKYDVLVARRLNGVSMTRRDKGPYWIIYPRDDFAELNDPRYDYRWVWQLRHIIQK